MRTSRSGRKRGNTERVHLDLFDPGVEPNKFTPGGADEHVSTRPLVPRWIPFLLVLGLIGMAARQGFRPIGDPDTWWHLRLGDDIWHNWNNITDPPAWTRFATQHWVATEWLPEVVAGRIEHFYGLPGVVWLFCAGLVLTTAVLYLVCRGEADVLAAAVATLIAFLGMSATLTPRPQMVSFILLLIVTGAWLRTARDLRPRWWLVPVSWLWACSHGFWFAGIAVGAVVVVGLFLDRRIRGAMALRLLAIPVSGLLLAGLTPVGPRLLLSPFAVSGVTQFITEWAPPSIRDLSPAATAVMIAVVALTWARGRRVAWTYIGLLLLATCWAMLSARTVTLAAAMTAPLMAGALQSSLPDDAQKIGRREVAALGAVVVAALAVVTLLLPASTGTAANVPVALDASLDRLPAHTVIFNDSALGGWLVWRHSSLEPVIDGRSEAFPVAQFEGYIKTSQVSSGWERFLQTTNSTYALVKDGSPLATALNERLHWRSLGSDDGYVLLASRH
jgi:hypothetical protein